MPVRKRTRLVSGVSLSCDIGHILTNFTKPVPIAFAITELDPGGAERALVQIVTRLDRAEWEPHVLCLTGEGELVETLRERGILVTCLHGKRWRPFQLISRLTNTLRDIRPAILQSFLFHANLAGRWAAKKANVPIVISGIRVAERRSRLRLKLDRRTEHLVDRHVCVSRDVAEFSATKGRLSREKIVVIPNGVDFGRFANAEPADLSEFGIPKDHKTILNVGRLDKQKGVMTVLNAFAELTSTRDDLHLLFVGDGPLRRRAERFVRRNALASRVHFAGYRNDVPRLMRAADCLVLASLWEGMPNVVLEAMAAGLPVVSTDVEGVRELIEDGRTGRIVSPQAPIELRRALEAVLSAGDAAAEMGRAAQNVVQQLFTWESVAAKYTALYRERLADNGVEVSG